MVMIQPGFVLLSLLGPAQFGTLAIASKSRHGFFNHPQWVFSALVTHSNLLMPVASK